MALIPRFGGKVAIVTGGASGIGLATARRLASEAARVVVLDRDDVAAVEVAATLAHEGAPEALGIVCDVSNEADVENAVSSTLARFGRLDVVVNNAGTMSFKPIEEFTGADWARIIGVNLMGAVHLTRQAFLHMRGGAVVNLSSVHAERTSALVAPYAATKAAILSLTRSAAIEGAERNIRVNAVLPGAIDTPMLWDNPNVKSGAERIQPREIGAADDVAAAIAFLASDDATFITGASLAVDGGRLGRL